VNLVDPDGRQSATIMQDIENRGGVVEAAKPEKAPSVEPSISINMLGKQTPVLLVVMLGALVLNGCFTIVRDRAYTFREPVRIDTSVIETNGYFFLQTEGADGEADAYGHPLILWQDGTLAKGFVNLEKTKFDYNIEAYIENNVSWGAYRVHGDTIRMQYLASAIGGIDINTYRVVRYEGRIRGDTAISIHSVEVTSGPREGTSSVYRVYHFEPLPPGAKPDSSNWLHERYRTGDDS